MRRWYAVGLFLVLAVGVGAEEIACPVVRRYEIWRLRNGWPVTYGGTVYVHGDTGGDDLGVWVLDTRTMRFDRSPVLRGVAGTLNGRFKVSTIEDRRRLVFAHSYFYDPATGELGPEFKVNVPWTVGEIVEYQNGQFFASGLHGGTYRYDGVSGSNRRLRMDYPGEPIDVSPDREHLLVVSDLGPFIYDIESETPIGQIERGPFISGGLRFLTNDLVAVGMGNRVDVFSLQGRPVAEFTLNAEGIQPTEISLFDKQLRYALLMWDDGSQQALIDLGPLRKRLDEMGLLFRPTTGVANASGVRVRQNANLEAQTLGMLERGDAVEVVDRSGVKEKIGGLEDWWYRVKRARDGLEGWAYGAYLDLAEKQGYIIEPYVEEVDPWR